MRNDRVLIPGLHVAHDAKCFSPEVSSIMRVLTERSLTGTYLYSLCVKPDISTTSASKRSHY